MEKKNTLWILVILLVAVIYFGKPQQEAIVPGVNTFEFSWKGYQWICENTRGIPWDIAQHADYSSGETFPKLTVRHSISNDSNLGIALHVDSDHISFSEGINCEIKNLNMSNI